MNSKEFIEGLKKEKWTKVIGQFHNKFGEEYVIFISNFKNDKNKYYFVSGHETEWEWFSYFPKLKLMAKVFNLDEQEEKSILSIIKNSK